MKTPKFVGPIRPSSVGRLFKTFIYESLDVNDLYSSPNIVRVIKSRRMRWAGHVARMGEERGVYRVLLGKAGGKETTGET